MSEKYIINFEKVIPKLLTKDALQRAKETAEKIDELKFGYYQSRKVIFKDLMNLIDI